MFHKGSFRSLMVSWLVIGLLAAGCAAPATTVSKLPATSTPSKALALLSLLPTLAQKVTGKTTPTNQPTLAATVAPTLAPTTTPTVPAATQPTQAFGSIGMAEQIGDLSILAQQVKQASQSGPNKPKTGDEYLLVTVSITNTSQAATVQFDPATFTIEDAATHKTYPVVTLKSLPDQLTAQMLKPGAQLKGLLAFEIPRATIAKLELELSTPSRTLYWTIGA